MIKRALIHLSILGALLSTLAGCAQNEPIQPLGPPRIIEPVATRTEFDELLQFGADMAEMSPAKRAESCKALVKQTDPRIPLKLMIGRMLSGHCGNIAKIIGRVKRLELNDERLAQWVAINTEALLNLLSRGKKSTPVTERKSRSAPEPVTKSPEPTAKDPQTTQDEAQLLREKLEAIRSIEKQMDESSEGY